MDGRTVVADVEAATGAGGAGNGGPGEGVEEDE